MEYICARCAAVSHTCCQMNPEEASVCFPLSKAEADRLAPYAKEWGIPPGVTMENTKKFVRNLRYLFPQRQHEILAAYPLSGEHLILPTSSTGACLFLDKNGCRLPSEARPWYCRLFPLWFRKGTMDLFASYQCLITREAPGARQALKVLGLSEERARKLYQNLCRDWGLL